MYNLGYLQALSLFQSHGVPEDHLHVMEEEVLYWVNQATNYQVKTPSDISVDERRKST